MSQENVEIVREMNEAFNRGDESWVAFFDPEAQFHTPPEFPDDSVYTGHEGIRRGAAVWIESFTEYRWDLDTLFDERDCVVGLFHHRGRLKDSGAWIERPVGTLYYLRDGRIVRVLSYFSWAEALKAVGLEE
jgi:ketosteroid isomerase-like protein